MKGNKEIKERIVAWLYPELISKMDDIILTHNMKNYTELITKALDFYIGYLGTQNSTNYLSKTLLESISGLLKENETRNSNNLFRLAVEMSMMMNILAVGLDIDEVDLRKLRNKCLKDVRASKCKISLEEALKEK